MGVNQTVLRFPFPANSLFFNGNSGGNTIDVSGSWVGGWVFGMDGWMDR